EIPKSQPTCAARGRPSQREVRAAGRPCLKRLLQTFGVRTPHAPAPARSPHPGLPVALGARNIKPGARAVTIPCRSSGPNTIGAGAIGERFDSATKIQTAMTNPAPAGAPSSDPHRLSDIRLSADKRPRGRRLRAPAGRAFGRSLAGAVARRRARRPGECAKTPY